MLSSAHINGVVIIYNVTDKIIEEQNVFAWVSLLVLAN